MRKHFVTLLLMLTLLFALGTTAHAADVVDSGTCGDNITWTLDSDGVLPLSGTGVISDATVKKIFR